MTTAALLLIADLAWMLAGVLVGVGGMVLRQRVRAWREARAYEWDPY